MRSVAVLGAGVMGSQIAGLLAGLGVDVLLLDILPPKLPDADEQQRGVTEQDSRWRNKIATSALEKLKKLKPPPLYQPSDVSKIRVGNFSDDLGVLKNCDWVIEAVIERLDIKRDLFAKMETAIGPQTIVTSNTSGLSVAALLEGRSDHFRRSFCVTHFFNPPRYLKLLELVPGPSTDPEVLHTMKHIGEKLLGKGVVLAKDTPNFIANRIGVFHFLDIIHLTLEHGWPIEAVDAVLGAPTAHPKSGIFRTGDVVGLDTLAFVAETVFKGCPNDPAIARFRIPQLVQQMIAKGWIGQKSGQGFYRKDKTSGAITVLDPTTLDYRPQTKFRTPSLGEARNISDPAARLRQTVFADDQAGEIAWPAISRTLVYAASRIPEIADDVVSIDRAMRWGFGLELGPFEMWDALGVGNVVERLERDKVQIPQVVRTLLNAGKTHFYQWQGSSRHYFDVGRKTFIPESGREACPSLKRLKELEKKVCGNAGATLIDIGDGVLCLEFHTKMNAIDADIIEMINTSLDRVEKDGVGLLIANEGEHFCAGANLLLILMAAQQKRWDELDQIIREFQGAMQRIRFSSKPVVAAPFGMAVGGGCEVVLACSRRQAAVESYIGLVEVGAGVVPAGCGCKNMILNFDEELKRNHNPKDKIWFSPVGGGPFPKVAKAFELIAVARVAVSALEAKKLGMLQKSDGISLDRDTLLYDAKISLLELAKNYAPPKKRDDIWLPGRGGKMALVNAIKGFELRGQATPYDAVIGEKLAHVLAGGDMPHPHFTTEDHILDLEREAFLSLCGNEKTHERMQSLLTTGKPLRN